MPLSAQTAGKREREENQNGRYCDEKKRFSTLWANAIAPLQVHPSCTNGIDRDSSHMHILQFLVVFVFASLSLSLSLLSSSSFCPRLSCPRRSPRSFFSHLSRECFASNALRLSTTETTSFLHALESVSFLLLSLSSLPSSLSLSFSVVQILCYVVCSSSSSYHYVYIIYLCVCLLMLLVMDCGVFFMQNENLCVFSKINFLVEKRSSHSQQQHAPSFLSHLHHFITRRRRF